MKNAPGSLSLENLEALLALTDQGILSNPTEAQRKREKLQEYADLPDENPRHPLAQTVKIKQKEISEKIRQILSLCPPEDNARGDRSERNDRSPRRTLGIRRPSSIEKNPPPGFLDLLGQKGRNQILQQCQERGKDQTDVLINEAIPSFFHGMTMVKIEEVPKSPGSAACVIACAIHFVTADQKPPLLLKVAIQKMSNPKRGRSRESTWKNLRVRVESINAYNTGERAVWEMQPNQIPEEYFPTDKIVGRLWGGNAPSQVYAFTPLQLERKLQEENGNEPDKNDAGINDEYECHERLAKMTGKDLLQVLGSIPWKEELEKMVQSGDFATLVQAGIQGKAVLGSSLRKVDESIEGTSMPFRGRSRRN